MGSWRVDFEPADLLKDQQPAITTAVTTAHKIPALSAARYAVVYSAGGTKWWHTSKDDSTEHVTVRFLGANRPTRAHVYRNGTATIKPSSTTRAAAGEDDGTLSPFTDEEVETGGKATVTGN